MPLNRPVFPTLAIALASLVLAAAPGIASATPTISLPRPTVTANTVAVAATLTSNNSCGATPSNYAGCLAYYNFSGPFTVRSANLWWNDFGGVQPIPQEFNLRGYPAGTYTVQLMATDTHGTRYASNAQQFQWPAGSVAVGDARTIGGGAMIGYRVSHGATGFERATARITLSRPSGRRLGAFRDAAVPGWNLKAIPGAIARRLQPGSRYAVRVQLSDEYGRDATSKAVVRFPGGPDEVRRQG